MMAARNVKVLIVEEDGLELSEQTEMSLTSEIIPFSDPSFLLSTTDVKLALLELKTPATNLRAGLLSPEDKQKIDLIDNEGDYDFKFEGALIINQDCSFVMGDKRIKLKSKEDIALEVTSGILTIGTGGSVNVGPTSSFTVRSI